MPSLSAKAYAKINWDLHILGKRPDGFHELDTVMVNVSLHDVLEFQSADRISLRCSDPTLPTDDGNLVVRAAKLLAKASGYRGGAAISLQKNIPAGGGMGGGSSDAACTLKSLNQLWELNWSAEQLQPLAAELGSDIAHFLYGGWTRCRGRGEIVEPLAILRNSANFAVPLLLIVPPWPVATPSVYKRLKHDLWDRKSKLRNLTDLTSSLVSTVNSIQTGKLSELGLSNDLIHAAVEVEPRLGSLQSFLSERYPSRWLMSGSGSVHFVIPVNAGNDDLILKETLSSQFGVGIRVHSATTYSS